MKRFLPISILAIGLLIAVYFDLHAYLSLDRLSEYYGLLKTDIQHQYFITICILASVYIVTVTFSIPGASVLSLLYGALLGTWVSGTLVVFAATFGATLIFIAARYALHDILKNRAGPWVHKMSAGFNDNAVSYMLFLRLVPAFPFFAVNLVPAFMGVKLRTFVLTTFFGIIPGTFVFASIGNGIGAVIEQGGNPKLDNLLTVEILLPLVALGILSLIPMVYKTIKKRQSPT
ncbi:MAG: VTT domain-containing protein [Proteobacteria bacterium]|jgi:uncharacterized membrane protein YdjX (TVP38/TMEM64 family)|nr:VTT domain-containing protein [Pseudomonadota bacterium]